jgi:DNA topoisomerase IB
MDTSSHRVPGLVYVSDEEPGISRRRAGRGFNGSALTLAFRGKGGKQHTVEVDDHRIRRIVRTCQEIPGQELFQYLTDDGSHSVVGSSDVNDYLRETAGKEFSAKDFRTWAGTVACVREPRLTPWRPSSATPGRSAGRPTSTRT